MGRIQEYSALNCAVNPAACREREWALIPALRKKKILIVGGGVAGMEAARVSALRGHQPIVCEKTGQLGGNLLPGGAPDFKEDDLALVRWFEHELHQLGVEIRLNTEVDADYIRAAKADTVLITTGSKPVTFSLGEHEKVYPAARALLGEIETGQHVVVVGGGLVGCETALWLAQQGKTVHIVEALDKILKLNAPLCHANSDMLEELIPYNGIAVHCSARAVRTTDQGLLIDTSEGRKEIQADTVLLCVGYQAERSLYEQLKYEIPDIHVIGDAKNVANIMYAIWDAYQVAGSI